MRPALLLLVAAAATMLGCRSMTRSIFNRDMQGYDAPALTGSEWILGEGEQAPPGKQWTVLVFFRPT